MSEVKYEKLENLPEIDYHPIHVDHGGYPICSKCGYPLNYDHTKRPLDDEYIDYSSIDGAVLHMEILYPCPNCGENHRFIFASNVDEILMAVEVEE